MGLRYVVSATSHMAITAFVIGDFEETVTLPRVECNRVIVSKVIDLRVS
jgi:hypothetical protein